MALSLHNTLTLASPIFSPHNPPKLGSLTHGVCVFIPVAAWRRSSCVSNRRNSSEVVAENSRCGVPGVSGRHVIAPLLLARRPLRCRTATSHVCHAGATTLEESREAATAVDATDPLLLRAVRGEVVERPPVWMMRQAGRYMKVYQELCEKHPTFRERSENVDLAVEVSLQPWRAFKPDGVILFSDILTPLTGMNIPFDILKSKGPVIHSPIRTAADVAQVRELVPDEAVPYVGQALTALRSEVKKASAVLGFVGAPFTLASYIVEGGSSKHFTVIKRMAFEAPEILHSLLQKLAESIIIYVRYQADSGAQAVQIFDSWATQLSPVDFEVFSLPYIKQIVTAVKSTHPALPLILYASGSGGLLERMASTGVDVMSIDWTVDMADARQRIGTDLAVQGNMDPAALFGTKEFIEKRIQDTVAKAGQHKHILNLGHGVLVGTPEENVAHFFETSKSIRY